MAVTSAPEGGERTTTRGSLSIYLGAAAGVGKTYAMLREGHRLHDHRKDVIIAYVDSHGREPIDDLRRGLEEVPCRAVTLGGRTFEELDLEGVLARHPAVALVDEYAHTNTPDSRHARRWQDVEELLDAGVDIISTLNIQHLESLNDVVETITGVAQRETVPDSVVQKADQLVIVDVTPEALRRRIGEEQSSDQAEIALNRYFQVGNLAALRQLALQWVADRADDQVRGFRTAAGVTEPWDTHERIMVALRDDTEFDHVLRRGARLAARSGADLIAVRVLSDDGLADRRRADLDRQRTLTESLGGRLVELHGSDTVETLLTFARLQNATQLVLGTTHRARARWLEGATTRRLLRAAGPIDVHLVATRPAAAPRVTHRRPAAPLPPRRQLTAWLLALVATPALSLALIPFRGTQLGLSAALLILLLAVVAVALTGGLRPALAAAVIAFGVSDWYYVAPLHSLRIANIDDLLVFAVFATVATVVSLLGARLARRGNEARRARAEAEAFARLATASLLPASSALPPLLEALQAAFELEAVAVLSPSADPAGPWRVEAAVGEPVPTAPADARWSIELADDSILVTAGRELTTTDRELLAGFAGQLRRAQERIRLQADAASASVLAEANRLRSAILASVSHDLRTPLTSIKAAATSVLSPEVDWSDEAVRSFAELIDEEADRLNRVVANLLDLSRLQAGSQVPRTQPTRLADVTATALASLHRDTKPVVLDLEPPARSVRADPVLLEHILANLLDNALNWSPPDAEVRVVAQRHGDRVAIAVADQGPGIPAERRPDIVRPFQRLYDHATVGARGVGLGLAVAHGLTGELGGTLTFEETPGGGTTVVVDLPAAS